MNILFTAPTVCNLWNNLIRIRCPLVARHGVQCCSRRRWFWTVQRRADSGRGGSTCQCWRPPICLSGAHSSRCITHTRKNACQLLGRRYFFKFVKRIAKMCNLVFIFRFYSFSRWIWNKIRVYNLISVFHNPAGLETIDDEAVKIIVIAVEQQLRSLVKGLLMQRNGYKLRDGIFPHAVGSKIPNPWTLNTQRRLNMGGARMADVAETLDVDGKMPAGAGMKKEEISKNNQYICFKISCSRRRPSRRDWSSCPRWTTDDFGHGAERSFWGRMCRLRWRRRVLGETLQASG